MQINKGVRCGNHGGVKIYHATVADVRECYEWTRAQKDAHTADLPSWITDEDPDFVRPAPREGRKVSGWWNLPIARTMWHADAASIER